MRVAISLKNSAAGTGAIKALSEISGFNTIHKQVLRNRLQGSIISESSVELLGFHRIFEQVFRNRLEAVAVDEHIGKIGNLRKRTAHVVRDGFQFLICLADILDVFHPEFSPGNDVQEIHMLDAVRDIEIITSNIGQTI